MENRTLLTRTRIGAERKPTGGRRVCVKHQKGRNLWFCGDFYVPNTFSAAADEMGCESEQQRALGNGSRVRVLTYVCSGTYGFLALVQAFMVLFAGHELVAMKMGLRSQDVLGIFARWKGEVDDNCLFVIFFSSGHDSEQLQD